MPFIRQNLFLIVLAGVTLVLVGGLLVVNSGVAGDNDQQTAMRVKLADGLKDLKTRAMSKPPALVNQATIAKLTNHVKAVKELSDEITTESEAWNKRNYQPYKYTVGEDMTKFFPAFPLKEPNATNPLARLQAQGMARQYAKKLDEKIAELGTTWVPDENAIKDAIKDAEEKLKDENWRPTPVAGSGGTVGTVAAGAASADAEIKAKATRDGTSQVVVKKSEEGLVYFNKDSAITQVLSGTELDASHSQLWEAQLQLWILSDVVAAIDQTNQQALSGQGGAVIKQPAVTNAAIKQLVGFHIEPRYALGEGSDTGNAYGGGGAPRAAAPEYSGARSAGAAGDTGIKGSECLTQRVTTRDYDVNRYTVTMVMATRYLKDFERYLMERNYHTILSVRIEKLETGSALGADINKFHFGPEQVMVVTINGELLLLSGWERAMMPKDVLEEWVPRNLR